MLNTFHLYVRTQLSCAEVKILFLAAKSYFGTFFLYILHVSAAIKGYKKPSALHLLLGGDWGFNANFVKLPTFLTKHGHMGWNNITLIVTYKTQLQVTNCA
jgi:hypothetical protein